MQQKSLVDKEFAKLANELYPESLTPRGLLNKIEDREKLKRGTIVGELTAKRGPKNKRPAYLEPLVIEYVETALQYGFSYAEIGKCLHTTNVRRWATKVQKASKARSPSDKPKAVLGVRRPITLKKYV